MKKIIIPYYMLRFIVISLKHVPRLFFRDLKSELKRMYYDSIYKYNITPHWWQLKKAAK